MVRRIKLALPFFILIFLASAQADLSVDSVSYDPNDPTTAEEFDISVEASDTGYGVDTIQLEWTGDTPEDWDTDSKTKSCGGVSTCDKTFEDISFSNSGEKDFEVTLERSSTWDSTTETHSIEITDEQSPNFELTKNDGSDDWSPDGIENEDSSKVDIQVENIGDAEGTQEIEYNAEFGTDSEEITLEPGDEQDVVLEVEPGSGDNGEYTGTVSSNEDSLEVDFEVEEAEEEDDDEEDDEDEGSSLAIDNVDIDPENPETNDEFDISVEASDTDYGVDTIQIEWDNERPENWDSDAETKSCGGVNTCDKTFEDISFSDSGDYDFEVTAERATNWDSVSSSYTVSVSEAEQEHAIDEYQFLDLPDEQPVGEELEVEAEATGTNLDRVEINYQLEDSILWRPLESKDSDECASDDECALSESYTQDSLGETEFRLTVFAGENEEELVETVEFVEDDDEEEPEPVEADFDYNPSNPNLDEEISFDASSSTGDIEDHEWDMKDGTTKTGEETTHTYTSTGTYNVELTVTSGEGEEDTISRPVTVNEEGDEFEQSIDNVRLLDLPETHPTGDQLDIEGEASGQNIGTLEIQYKPEDSILWRRVGQKNCELEDTCTISSTYTQDSVGETEFRITATAGEEQEQYSESVRFFIEDDGTDPEDPEDPEDPMGEGELHANVEDAEGNPIEDAEIRAENSETLTRFTDIDGEAYLDLNADTYDVRVSKTGFRTETRTVTIEEDETNTEHFTLDRGTSTEGISITNIQHSSNVCSGEYLSIDVSIQNSYQDRTESVEITAQGIGENPSKFVVVNPGEERTKELTVTNLDETGTYNFNIVAENGETISQTRTVTVEDCTTQISNEATGLTMNIDPHEINAGQTVTASGYLDGLRGQRGEITIKADGETVARTNNDRDGYYQTYFKVHEPGEKTITAESQGLSQRRTLTVHPTVHIESIDMPDTVVEGEEFQICGQVQSQSETRVVLESGDGEVIEAKDGLGETCFETTARETGEKEYQVRAFTSGSGSSSRSTVRVIETGPETQKFPDVVATETSESGEFKVELYNKEEETKVYKIDVGGLDRNWISQSSREVHLTQGERETVYFYLTPRVGGTYHPEVNVTVNDELILEDDVMVETRGNPRQTQKTFVNRIKSFLQF